MVDISPAANLRRQAALARTARRLKDRAEVPEEDRSAVLDAIGSDHGERSSGVVGLPGDRQFFGGHRHRGRFGPGAHYVAAAERQHTALVTADHRISRPGAEVTCKIVTV